jgi:hypothetical protein
LKIEQFDEKLRRYKSNWLWHVTRINNNGMPKIILNYRPCGRRRLGRPIKSIADSAETGLSRLNWRRMMMKKKKMMMMMKIIMRRSPLTGTVSLLSCLNHSRQRPTDVTSFRLSKSLYPRSAVFQRTNNFGCFSKPLGS